VDPRGASADKAMDGTSDKMLVTISEPMTLATDYLLGTVSGACAWRLRQRGTSASVATGYWGAALAAAGAASFTGGTYHGFTETLGPAWASALWKATTICMGAASCLLLVAALTASFSGARWRWLSAVAALKFAVYAGWMLGHDDFRFVIYDYGSTLSIVLLLSASGRLGGTGAHRAYVTGGILASIAAAVVQQSGVRLHRHFNHNDLMHVVQMGGVWLLYQGGARLRDRGSDGGHA
jgi:hypothetical protein